jgi:hypothetical protein
VERPLEELASSGGATFPGQFRVKHLKPVEVLGASRRSISNALGGSNFDDEALLHPAAVVRPDPVVEAVEDVSEGTGVSRQREGAALAVDENQLEHRGWVAIHLVGFPQAPTLKADDGDCAPF